jgi:hypothetical protein
MKLIYCKKCGDVYSANYSIKSCSCGATKAVYIDVENMLYGGDSAICLGIDNNALNVASNYQRLEGYATRIDAYTTSVFCHSTIKIDNFEKMNDDEIFHLIARHDFPAERLKGIEDRKIGKRKVLYWLCKSFMEFKINKSHKKLIEPEMDKWYANFTDRVLDLSKRLSSISNYSVMEYFTYLLKILFKDPNYIIQLEKMDNNQDLYEELFKLSLNNAE